MSNMYEAMIGGMTPQQDPAVLAARLRSRGSRATLAQLSGDPVLGKYGSGEQKRIHDTAKNLGANRLSRAKMAQQDTQHQEGIDSREETSRLTRALTESYYNQMAGQSRERNVLTKSKYAADAKYRADTLEQNNLDREAELEIARMKGVKYKALPSGVQDKIIAAANEVKTMRELYNGIEANTGQSSIPGVSTAETYLANNFGVGTEATKKKAEWWSKFDRQWNIVKRNEKFGATLTPHEKAAWEAATINKEMSVAQIKSISSIILKYAVWNRDKLMNSLTAGGNYNPAELKILADSGPEDAGVLPPVGNGAENSNPKGVDRKDRTWNAATGAWEQ